MQFNKQRYSVKKEGKKSTSCIKERARAWEEILELC